MKNIYFFQWISDLGGADTRLKDLIQCLKQTNNYNCAQQISKLCYKWSSNRIPPFPVRIGSQADVQITTIYKHPIEFVMPALRKALGLVTDS